MVTWLKKKAWKLIPFFKSKVSTLETHFETHFGECSAVALAHRADVDQREDDAHVCEDAPQWRGVL